MTYYHDLITEKSWKLLHEFRRKHKFILIGGWAVFLYTKALKSKDIDIICEYEGLERLREHHALVKNDRLKKYEIHEDGIDIDIYTPFYSDLGVPVEHLKEYAVDIEGFKVISPEALLITKERAWRDRGHSIKGEKDRIDIIVLLKAGVNFDKFKQILKGFNLKDYVLELGEILNSVQEVPEIGLNKHNYAKLKKSILLELKS